MRDLVYLVAKSWDEISQRHWLNCGVNAETDGNDDQTANNNS